MEKCCDNVGRRVVQIVQLFYVVISIVKFIFQYVVNYVFDMKWVRLVIDLNKIKREEEISEEMYNL